MYHRFCSKLLGGAVAISFGVSLFTPTSAISSEESNRPPVPAGHTQTGSRTLAITPQLPIHSHNQLTAAVVLPSGAQVLHPQSVSPNGTLRTPGEDEEALRTGLAHSSRGMAALTAGDLETVQKELEASLSILARTPEAIALSGLRLQLVEETAFLKAALSGASAGQEIAGQANGQEEEDEADTEVAPDLVAPDEAQNLVLTDSEIVAVPELDTSNFDVPVVLNEQVKEYVLYYQSRKYGVMRRAFERSGRYLPMMREIFREQGLPLDLVNLAYIESTFNYRAYSKAKASGIWQFIKGTGTRYGMKVNYWLDERRDPEKATRGAAAYLKELYEMFHSWPLALAAYNAGEHRIQRAIEQQGTTDFWSLRLPKETELFVPAFMAVTIISKDPSRYGFIAPVETPWKVDRVIVPGAIELRSIARIVGVSPDLIRDLNPALMRGVTPATSIGHEIILPPDTKEILLANLDQLPRVPAREMVRPAGRWHRVGKGENLRSIALRHQTTLVELAGLNGMKVSDSGLKVGRLLRLPLVQLSSEQPAASARTESTRNRTAPLKKAVPASRPTAYVVKQGDTLWKIARIYGVRPEDLRQWNNLKQQAKLKPGLTLQVVAQAGKNNHEAGRGAPASPSPIRYRVRQGDTLWAIARNHDVTPDELRRWNDLGRKTTLLVGQALTVRMSPKSQEGGG